MKPVTIVGRGPIARTVADAVLTEPSLHLAAVLVRADPAAFAPHLSVTSPVDVPPGLVADCAGTPGLRAHGRALLCAGHTLYTLSAAALADDALRDDLVAAAREGGGQLVVVSGAIGAIDALAAAAVGGLPRVTYVGRKPPAGWRGSAAETRLDLGTLSAPAEHFRGTARDAALRYPKNANVAAAVALAGVGFDATEVVLIADPSVRTNTHRLEVEGAFGSFSAEFSSLPLPDNPRSSALAAYAMIAALKGAASTIRMG